MNSHGRKNVFIEKNVLAIFFIFFIRFFQSSFDILINRNLLLEFYLLLLEFYLILLIIR